MKHRTIFTLLIISWGLVNAQEVDTFKLHYAISKGDTTIYTRIIDRNTKNNIFFVRDIYDNGQVQMEAFYSSFNKEIKEEYQCNYKTNTKEGQYKEWYKNGQIEYIGNFKKGLRNGQANSWYMNGQKQSDETWKNGQLNGKTKYWLENGDLQYVLKFRHGQNLHPKNVDYKYLTYLPVNYKTDTLIAWPLIIYLHGGSDRGNDLNKLYSSGIPDQIYRGRNFPFIIISPQCPKNIRWETENWFKSFFKEIVHKYRIDTNRVYLTGLSLGGAGTWYLAAKYPDIFAAIAPISGFTSHNDFLDKNISKLVDTPIWAFHGKIDNVVPFEETERIVKKLEPKNHQIKFTVEPNVGHWMHWLIYPNQDLYNWFLKYSKNK
jgi:pimeloyl-ACP methyl ester carboxylesterase